MVATSADVFAPAPRAAAPLRTPPVVGARALLGSLSSVLRGPLDFLLEQRARNGDVYTLDLGVTRMILLHHPRHAQHVYRDHHARYGKTGPFWDLTRTLFGDGLPVAEGKTWRRQRRLIQPHFHRERISAMVDQMVHAVRDSMASWDALADAGPVDVASAVSRVAMHAIVRVIFGAELDPRDADEISGEVGHALDFILRGMLLQSLPPWLPVPGRRRYLAAIRTIDRHIFRLVEQRRQKGGGADLLTAFMDSVDAETGARMTDTQLRDEVVAMFLAGYETVASMLTFAVDLLARHPEHAGAARDEIREVLGEREPQLADLPRLGGTLAVLQETLRLYPPVFFLPRQAAVDDEIDGFAIPAGAVVAPVVYAIHRHPDVWDQPERFDPGRFTAARAGGRHPLAWMPFGTGQRQCLGKDFALLEGRLILARILQRYELAPVSAAPPRAHLGATARPGRDVQIRFTRLQRQ